MQLSIRTGRCLALAACLLATAGLRAQPPAGNAIAVSPANLTLDLSAGEDSGALRVFNMSDEPLEITTRVHHFDLDTDNEVRVIPPTPQSLDQWLLINPLRFTVPPRGQQAVRFAVRPRAQPEPGEHRAMVFFQREPQDAGEATVAVAVRVGIALYATVEPVYRTGRLLGLDVETQGDAPALRLDVGSEGNALVRLSGDYALWPEEHCPGEDSPLGALSEADGALPEHALLRSGLPKTPVFPDTRRSLRVSLAAAPLVSGRRYCLLLRGAIADTELRRTLRFTAP